MAATSDQQMESLLSNFDQIYEDFKSGMKEIEVLRSNSNVEATAREALEITNKSLKQENERLKKLYTESLNNVADQFEHRTKCHGLKEELKRVNDENKTKEHGHWNSLESLKLNHASKVEKLENKIRSLLLEKATNEMVVDRLRQDLTSHKKHIQSLSKRLDQVYSDVESKYQLEIQDLKDCLLVEQEERKDITNRLQDLQKELLISKTTFVEQRRDMTSARQVETLKVKVMKLRKENEILKRKLSSSSHNSQEPGFA
ncbi:PREDICTED: protein At-4/1 [Tarenaya hassleriana]|uniref:protein At-4/1 n=1 Tax=Tarenaya hassleriana TaxID=28532 RepID=UPI00053C359F|nr:PREDICTED: protein At-4/1 [Tarenaya hassleriana]XP_010539412.1 PREDICTED: protein At-4/1 [Tarenaya hassleriana]